MTPRMMPGVVALGEGAYDPDTKRVDKGGYNVLTTQRPSPLAKGIHHAEPCSG